MIYLEFQIIKKISQFFKANNQFLW